MIFKDTATQKEVNDKGFVHLPLLNNDEVLEIKAFIETHTPIVQMANEFGFIQGVCLKERQLKNEIDTFIRKIVHHKLENVLKDFKAIIYTVVAKGIGENSQLDIHQDWSVVDENKYASYSLWIPLIDSVIENGAVHIIEGSHKLLNNIRGGSIASIYDTEEKRLSALKKMKAIEMKAGEVLFLNQRMTHYSPPNKTNEVRISVISTIVQKNATIFQYYKKDNRTIEVYEMNDNFFFNYNDFVVERELTPKGEKLKEIHL